MGDVPVIVRVVWSDGTEEWRPARAVRWTRTHVMVGWRADEVTARPPAATAGRGSGDGGVAPAGRDGGRGEQWVWLRAGDVMRSVTWLVAPDRGTPGGPPRASRR